MKKIILLLFTRIIFYGALLIGVCIFLYTPRALLSAAPRGVVADITPTLEKVIRTKIDWIAQRTLYDTDVPLPRIIFLTGEEVQTLEKSWGEYFLTKIRHSFLSESDEREMLTAIQDSLGLLDNPSWRVLAFYISVNNTIYIKRRYRRDQEVRKRYPQKAFYLRPRWSAVLIHELVHYLQDVFKNRVSPCQGLRELQAYHLESEWMGYEGNLKQRRIPFQKIIRNGCW